MPSSERKFSHVICQIGKMASASWALEGKGTNARVLSHPLHAKTLLLALNDSRKNPALCDGIIKLGNDEIPVQRNVLSAASPFFRALYQYESCQQSKVVCPDVQGLSASIFLQILDYIYTSVVILSEENIQDLLQAADLLLMADLKDLCCDYLEHCISVSNCLGIREFAERFSCPRISYLATNFMDEHFGEITYTEEFFQLTAEKLKAILQRNTLAVQTEDIIFDCIMRWVRYDLPFRQVRLPDLLTSSVHMGLLDERYLQECVIPDELIRKCELENVVLRMRKETANPKQRGFTNMIVVAGGEGPCEDDPNVVEIKKSVCCVSPHNSHEPKCSPWIKLACMSVARVGHGLVEAGGYLYAIGGRDNSGILVSGEKYDPRTDKWTAIAPMSHARVGFGLVTIGEKIYAIGGSNDMSDPLTSMEEYNIYTNSWRSLPEMNLKRVWSAYAVANKKIYVIGGGIMGKLYEDVECFDPRSEVWISVAPMKERRFDARAIGLGSEVYVFGGLRRLECPSAMNSGTGMKFCGTEVYLTEQKHWTTTGRNTAMCTMTETSHIDALAIYGDEILLIGELDIGGNYNCVRAYHPPSNSWRGVIQNHPPNQRGMQSATMKISNTVIYSHLWNQCKLTFADLK